MQAELTRRSAAVPVAFISRTASTASPVTRVLLAQDSGASRVEEKTTLVRAVSPSVPGSTTATGVMRHADAGYDIAIDCAREHGLNLPGILG